MGSALSRLREDLGRVRAEKWAVFYLGTKTVNAPRAGLSPLLRPKLSVKNTAKKHYQSKETASQKGITVYGDSWPVLDKPAGPMSGTGEASVTSASCGVVERV